VLLAVLLHGVARNAKAVQVWYAASFASLGLLLLLMHGMNDQSPGYYRGGALLVAVVTATLIATVERHPQGPVAQLLSVRPVVWLGSVSYGVYLWHWPVLLWVDGTVARIVLTLGISALSFYLVEQPIRSGTVPWVGKDPRRTAIAFAAACSLVACTAYVGSRPPSASSDPVAAQARDRALRPCKDLHQPCLRSSAGGGAPVVASIGDSTMEGYDPALRLLAQQHGFTYIQAAVPGCPLSVRPVRSGPSGTQSERDRLCEKEMPEAYADLAGRQGTDVFIGTSVREFLATVDADGNLLKTGTPEHVAAVRAGLEKAVGVLTARGASLVLLHILPRGAAPDCLSIRTSHEVRCTTKASDDKDAALYNRVFDQVAAAHPDSVKVVDLADLVCPHGRCPVVAHGLTLRGDQLHLTTAASEWIATFLWDRMRRAGVDI